MNKREKTQAEIEHEFDSAEVPTENIKAMRPFSELVSQKRMGRPVKENPKEQVTMRYDPEVLAAFRSTGAGWQTRMNEALKTYLKEHPVKAA